jgi:hypothetical protein
LRAIISHGGPEKWVRKENPVDEIKVVLVIVELFSAQDVDESSHQIKLRNTLREYQLSNPN